jgi:hypothetical protein
MITINEGQKNVDKKEDAGKIDFSEASFEGLKEVKNLEVEIEKQNLDLVLAEMNEYLGLKDEEKMKPRENGFHLTIIDPSESGFLEVMSKEQFENLKSISNNIREGKGIVVKGIGMIDGETSDQVRESDKSKKVCFAVIGSEELNSFRENMPERVDSKGKTKKLEKKDLHITLGFVGGDIHHSNIKNIETKANIPIRKIEDHRFDDIAKMIKLQFGGICGDKKEEKNISEKKEEVKKVVTMGN